MKSLEVIEQFGRRYDEIYLTKPRSKKRVFEDDWLEALLFFFSKAFYRGRRDKISEAFQKKAEQVLSEWRSRLRPGFDVQELNAALHGPSLKGKHNGVNNKHDRLMVCGALKFVLESSELASHDHNIVKYVLAMIDARKVQDAHHRLDQLHAVGDKLASLFLRDVVLVWRLEKSLRSIDQQYLQPLDTWVFQVAKKLLLPATRAKDRIDDLKPGQKGELKQQIIDTCEQAGVSPPLFNAGAWMLGAKSFDVLLDIVDGRIELPPSKASA